MEEKTLRRDSIDGRYVVSVELPGGLVGLSYVLIEGYVSTRQVVEHLADAAEDAFWRARKTAEEAGNERINEPV